MFRTTAVAVATTALLAASAASAQASTLVATPQADPVKMAASIRTQIDSKAFGWQFAISRNGTYVTSDKGGTAISAADNGGTTVPMQPTMKMDLMSATKTITAVATMKLLRANDLSVESSIDPYLPPGWTRGPGFDTKSVKFKHLLGHTSGLGQAIGAMVPQPSGNKWPTIQTVVAGGTVVDSKRQYKNMNYALLQVLNAELHKRSGGAIYETTTVGSQTFSTIVPVTEASYTVYALNYLRALIFEPAGLKNISCAAGDAATEAWSYPANALQTTNGGLITASSCGGHMGIRLSTMQHVQLLSHLRHGTIINPLDLAKMDELRLGWDEDSNGGDGGQFGTQNGVPDTAGSIGAFWHGGDGSAGPNDVHTCGATFNDGIAVSFIVNSPIAGSNQCAIVRNAWNASK